MIIKKVRRRAAGATGGSEFGYMNHLSRYIVRADVDQLEELIRFSDDDYLRDLARYALAEGREGKAVAVGGINTLGDTLAEWEIELAALLHRCPDPAGSIDHWIFSWPEGEEPTTAEMEQVFTIFMRCQGIANAKGLWGYHGDTDHRHGHLELVRIDPRTGARLAGGDGWDIDTAHRAKAVIEAQFPHWTPEAGSRYVVRDGILMERASNRIIGDADNPATWSRHRSKPAATLARQPSDHPAIDTEALAYEEATGFMSRKRVALDVAVPLVLSSVSLDSAHAALAEEGIELRRKGTGAVFVIDGKTVNASIHRGTSHNAIVKRFGGPLTPSTYSISDCGPRERWPGDAQRRAYYAARRPHDERLKLAVAAVHTGLGGSARSGAAAAALRAATSAATFPTFEAWRNGAVPSDPTELVLGAVQLNEVSVASDARIGPLPVVLHGYRATKLRDRVVYRKLVEPRGRPAFVDLGNMILVHAGEDRSAVRASLLLIASRYPDYKVTVTGDRAFQRLVFEIANEERVQLDGPLGRRQARRAAEGRSQVALTPGRLSERPASQTAPRAHRIPAAPATHRSSPHRVLAMVGRVFHDAEWLAGDYWGVVEGRAAPVLAPMHPRQLEDLPPPPSAPPPRHLSPANLAGRAAAIAAASRGR